MDRQGFKEIDRYVEWNFPYGDYQFFHDEDENILTMHVFVVGGRVLEYKVIFEEVQDGKGQ